MSLNARMSPTDNRLYNPGRDVAHNFGEVIMEVAKRIEAGSFTPVVELLKEKGVTEEELGKTIQNLALFVESDLLKKESMPAGLARCGFLDRSKWAQLAVMAHMGTIILGYHWAGVREATIGGSGPILGYKGLRHHGKMCALLMKMPRWKRRLYSFRTRLKAAWKLLWQKDLYAD